MDYSTVVKDSAKISMELDFTLNFRHTLWRNVIGRVRGFYGKINCKFNIVFESGFLSFSFRTNAAKWDKTYISFTHHFDIKAEKWYFRVPCSLDEVQNLLKLIGLDDEIPENKLLINGVMRRFEDDSDIVCVDTITNKPLNAVALVDYVLDQVCELETGIHHRPLTIEITENRVEYSDGTIVGHEEL